MQNKYLFGAAVLASQMFAQDVIQLRVPAPDEPVGQQTMMYQTLPTGEKPRVQGNFAFVRREVGGEIVKNAPYTADATTETVQALADGNRIVHKDSTGLARDSEGRTRRDLTLPLPPGVAPADSPRFSFIFDAPTNASFTLDHNTKSVRKSQGRAFVVQSDNRLTGGPVTATTSAPAIREMGAVGVAAGLPGGPVHFERRVEMGDMVAMRAGGPGNAKEESLGKQTIEGVVAEGTRTTTVIPVGEIGNERPMEIVSERWFSPELQVVVMSKFSDPRQGDTTYKLTNIRRSEPPKSLFEVPADYSVKSSEDQLRVAPGPRD